MRLRRKFVDLFTQLPFVPALLFASSSLFILFFVAGDQTQDYVHAKVLYHLAISPFLLGN
jgi:hypothetical protein